MKTFSCTVEETFTKRYEVKAEDEADAQRRIKSGMLNWDEFCPSADSDADYSNRIYDIYEASGRGRA